MTNAEVYIGDEDLINQFIDEVTDYYNSFGEALPLHGVLVSFFKRERTPILTDDERVILRNMNKETTITRYKGKLYYCSDYGLFKDDIFQFIKERRRIFN